MVEPITTEIDFVLRHRIEHERVIRVGGMSQGTAVRDGLRHLFSDFLIICLSGSVNNRHLGNEGDAKPPARHSASAAARRIALPSLLRRSGCEGWKRRRREMFIASN